MKVQDILTEQPQFFPIGGVQSRPGGELGTLVQTEYQWGSRQITLISALNRDRFGGGRRQRQYETIFFDLDDDDAVAMIYNVGGNRAELDYGNIGNPSYELPEDVAMAMYRHHWPLARAILEQRKGTTPPATGPQSQEL